MTTQKYRNAITFEARIEQRVRDRSSTQSFSETVNSDLGLLYGLLDALTVEMRGRFAPAEVKYLIDMLNSVFMDPAQIRGWAQSLAWSVEDAAALDGLDKKWGVDAKMLSQAVAELSSAEAAWLVDRVRTYWLTHDTKPMDELVAQLF